MSNHATPMVGLAFRRPMARWLPTVTGKIDCLELTAEHFFADTAAAEKFSAYARFVHGLGLSLGTPGPLDRATLADFAEVVRHANPAWISEHIAFTRTPEIDLGHLNPVRPTRGMVDVIAAHARELADLCGKPIILENITAELQLAGDFSEVEFLNRICDAADCGLLLDVTNLYINARNHRYDPVQWLDGLDCNRIVQLHVVGYTLRDGKLVDAHAVPIQPEILDLTREVLSRAPVKAVILERDGRLDDTAELTVELEKLRRVCERN